jgi:glycosyltransferase involved in cell wall biosynthesis
MSNNPYALTHVVTTRNKLPFLQEALSRMIRHLQPDEEIIVIDAASTDGTVEYLNGLHRVGKIHQFVSEPDRGEGHGYNKGMLWARGTLVKIHSDDDVCYHPGIQACIAFMLHHPDIDALATCAGGTRWDKEGPCHHEASERWIRDYLRWRETGKPFPFCTNGLMVRKSSLAQLGLFNVTFVSLDTEYSLRITQERHRLAWYTGICWVGNTNPRSQSVTKVAIMQREVKLLQERYMGIRPRPRRDTLKRVLKKAERWGKRLIRGTVGMETDKQWPFPASVTESFEICDRWLVEVNRTRPGEFLLPSSNV